MNTRLYNGVELPDIDSVWTDKDSRPHAYILSNTVFSTNYHSYNSEYLLLTDMPMGIARRSPLQSEILDFVVAERNSTRHYATRYILINNEWVKDSGFTYFTIDYKTFISNIVPVWCSTSISIIDEYNIGRDVTIPPTISNEPYLIASEPNDGRYDRYRYNDIKLADIYSAYNRYKTTYPYTLLMRSPSCSAPIVYAFKEQPRVVKEVGDKGECISRKLFGSSETMVFSGQPGDPGRILNDVSLILEGECTTGTFEICWSDFNILNDDDSIYFYSTDPVLVDESSIVIPEFNLKEWSVGYFLGVCWGAIYSMSADILKECIYGDVYLPKIYDEHIYYQDRPQMIIYNPCIYELNEKSYPELDNVYLKYPGYVYIWYKLGHNLGNYVGYVPEVTTVSHDGMIIVDSISWNLFDESARDWVDTSLTIPPPTNGDEYFMIDTKTSNIVWTNRDIYNEDGTLYLPASRPIIVP